MPAPGFYLQKMAERRGFRGRTNNEGRTKARRRENEGEFSAKMTGKEEKGDWQTAKGIDDWRSAIDKRRSS